jgi:preprotein translocase subunit YajC
MRKLLPAVILLIALAALAAGPVLAQEKPTEPASPPTEKPGKTLKIVTAGGGEEAGDDEEYLEKPEGAPPFEPDAEIRKMEVMIPIFGMTIPIIFMVGAVVVVIVAILLAQRTAVKRYEVIQAAIKEGRELPPDIFRNGRRGRRDPMLPGLVLTALGVALAIALGAVAGWVQAVWGFIPLFIGIALLIYVPFWRKQKKDGEETS